MPVNNFTQTLADPTTLLQSPYLYFQAAGSDGTDGSVKGFHLRWAFHRTLGNTHLPKGILSGPTGPYPASYGFNKIKDVVGIYRGLRIPPYPFNVAIATNMSTAPYLQLDFNVSVPILFVETGPTRYWQYNININNPLAAPQVPNRFVRVNVRFTDVAAYDNLVNNPYNPHTSRFQFFGSYKKMIEVELVNELMCEGIFIFKQMPPPSPSAEFKVEAVSVHPENFDDADMYKYLSARRILKYNDITEQRTITAENIKYFRFKNSEIYVRGIYLLSYYNAIYFNDTVNTWVHIGDFGLTDDDGVAFKRLEDTTNNIFVHKRWPKYNEINQPQTNAFTVNVGNYQSKWSMIDGLKEAVINYLTLSQNPVNPTAEDRILSVDSGDYSAAEINYLDLLHLAGIDFHVARMLGLGHIENIETVLGGPFDAPKRVMYLMEYVTENAFENLVPAQTRYHLYASLPTLKIDFRLPPVSRLKPLTYGISLSEAQSMNGPSVTVTDQDGYSLFDDVRIINLSRETFEYEKPFGNFFTETNEFIGGKESEAAAFGVEYKGAGEPVFRAPELSNDPAYFDPTGLINETIPIPNSDAQPLFIHNETEEGKHTYGLYSVNWFSRASQVGNQLQTDITKFVKKNRLVPPHNFAVQLIQDEQPLIFTTSNEQAVLSTMSGDKTLVRVTFDWNYKHNHAYQLATHAEFFFRRDLPKAVKGKTDVVFNLPDNRVRVTTKRYPLTSSSPLQYVQPHIPPSPPTELDRFKGSSFAVEGKLFIVEDVLATEASGDNPAFILKKIRETSMVPTDDPPSITETFIGPEADKMFMVTENLNDPARWESLLTRKVYIEYFHTVLDGKITGATPQTYNKLYTVMKAVFNGSNTEITMRQAFPTAMATTLGSFVYPRKLTVVNTSNSGQVLEVAGNVVGELTIVNNIAVIASQTSDGNYSITPGSVSYNGTNTEITVNPAVSSDDSLGSFYITFEKIVPVNLYSHPDKKIIVPGNLTQEIIPLYRETITESDGSETILNIGGLTDDCTVLEKEDVIDDGFGGPLLVPGSRTGVFELQFQNVQLDDHITPGVKWYKGKVRIMEDPSPAFVPPPGNPEHDTAMMKELDVLDIDTSSSTLKLTVYDPTIEIDASYNPIGDYVPILTTGLVRVNFHPSYRFYLTKDTANGNNFESTTILPAPGDGSKQTLMATRSIDKYITPQYESNISVPVILLAMEIVDPIAPDPPSGPTFATRPDYYGKATYSFDVKLNTSPPYAVIFYRANERMILDQLYLPATITQILTNLENLQSPDADYNVDRWSGLVNVDIDSNNGLFKEYTSGGYRFPIPDNNNYSIPNQNATAPAVHPFDGITPPGGANAPWPNSARVAIVQQAIDGAFLSLTEIPALYKYIPLDTSGTRQTSGKPPKIRDIDGRLLLFGEPGFDPFPMAVKYTTGSDKWVKFTDYTLDGASKNFYFYYAVEMTSNLKMSGHGRISGPIFLINAAPAEEPGIKKVTSLLADSVNGIPTGVKFDINDYIESERIRKIEIFRTPDFVNSHTVRTMDLAKTVDIGNDIIDDFSDVPVPLFGKTLYYRLVALREILNEDNVLEYVPSRPSQLVLSNVVDNFNPPAPAISFTYSGTSAGPNTLHDVILSWQPTCYNGKYYLYKMTPTGNWIKISETQSDSPIFIPLIDTTLANPNLIIEDDDSNVIYHRFRVEVENSSGLLNIEQNELTIPVP